MGGSGWALDVVGVVVQPVSIGPFTVKAAGLVGHGGVGDSAGAGGGVSIRKLGVITPGVRINGGKFYLRVAS